MCELQLCRRINPRKPPADINVAYAGLVSILKQLLKQVEVQGMTDALYAELDIETDAVVRSALASKILQHFSNAGR